MTKTHSSAGRLCGAAGFALTVLVILSGCGAGTAHIPQQSSGSTMSSVQAEDFDRAALLASQQRWAEADEVLTEILQAQPDAPRVASRLAWVRQQQAQRDEARALYLDATRQNPADAFAVNNLALMMQEDGEFKQAQSLFREGLKHSPDTPELHYNLAVLCELYLLDLPGAVRHYRQYQTLTPTEDKVVAGWLADLERRLQ